MTLPKAAPAVDVVWLTDGLREQEFFEFILSDLQATHSVAGEIPHAAATNTLYVLSTNKTHLSALPTSFVDSARTTAGVGLLHASDEWFGEDYRIYSAFSFVMRTHYLSHLSGWPNLLTVPLGWPNGGSSRVTVDGVLPKRYTWFFAGNIVGSRMQMLRSMRRIPGGFELRAAHGSEHRLDHTEYLQTLASSVFVPCPMGNVVSETWRVYEALEAGAIPLVERRMTLDYYRRLLGDDHPLPTFTNWADAADYVSTLAANPTELVALQGRVDAWWSGYKGALPLTVGDFVRARLGSQVKVSVSGIAASPSIMRRAMQVSELARHHNGPAALARIRLELARATRRSRDNP